MNVPQLISWNYLCKLSALKITLLWINFYGRTCQEVSKPGQEMDYCEFNSLKAKCEKDEVIVMTSATYGRMNLGKCVRADLGYVGCGTNVLDLADRECSGRQECTITVPVQAMKIRQRKSKQACMSELTSYLRASYTCQKVTSIDRSQCRSCDFVRVEEPNGVLASVVTKNSGCGSPQCPWRISVPNGQKINLTLINFRWDISHGNSRIITYDIDPNRQVLATVKESSRSRPETIYAGRERESHVYTSLGNTIELRVVPGRMNGENPVYSLFKYEAIGCTDPSIPEGSRLDRIGDKARLGCNHTKDTVTWICVNNKWEGPPISCQGEAVSAVVGYVKVGGLTLSFGLSVTVIVVLAMVICLVIVVVGLIIFKRKRALRHTEEPIYQPPPYMSPSYRDPPPSYDLKATIKRPQNGPREENGYTHIWQRPLPEKPEDEMVGTAECTYVQEPGSVHYGYNSIASFPRSHNKSCNSRLRGIDDISSPPSALRITKTGPADTRYFQVEDRLISNHVSA